MEICTHSLDGMNPSLTGQGPSTGVGKPLGHMPPGYSLCVGSGRSIVAKSAYIVVVVVVTVDGHGHVACLACVARVWDTSSAPVHFEKRSQALLRGLVRKPFGQAAASKIHDAVALIANNTIVWQVYIAHLV